ncbi:Melanoma inhibitory activity protein, partial [Actinidia chinensis var. chinensis]
MAARAILHRKKYLFRSLNQQTSLVQSFSNFEQGGSSNLQDLQGSRWASSIPSADRDHQKEDLYTLSKEESLTFTARGLIKHYSRETTILGFRNRRTIFSPYLGGRWISESVRYSSTSAAGQREVGSGNDGNEGGPVKQIKEASAEECDQAV